MEDWFENLSKEEIEEIEEIETGLNQATNNEFIDHEKVMEIFKKHKQNTDKTLNLEP